MKRNLHLRSLIPAALGLGLTLAIGTGAACDEPKDLPPASPPQAPKSTTEAIGDTVGNAVQSIKRGARTTSETVQEQYQHARNTIHDMGVQSRVYSRLHWEKGLADSKVDIEFHEGTAMLRGTVKSLAAKAKAVDLARDTIGVDRVEDHLIIEVATPAARGRD